jgi:hypothetical protein
MENYYEEKGDDEDHFPFVYLTMILSFAFILWIEKIATDAHSHPQDDEHGHGHDDHKVYSNY